MTLYALLAFGAAAMAALIWFSARFYRAGRNAERAGRARHDLEIYANAQKRAHEAATNGGPVDSGSVNDRLLKHGKLRDRPGLRRDAALPTNLLDP